MRYGVKYMEKPEDDPEVLAAVAFELYLRLEDYGVHVRDCDVVGDAHAVISTLLRFGWRQTHETRL
jgi:hypothetical protein